MKISQIDFRDKVPKSHWKAWEYFIMYDGRAISVGLMYCDVMNYVSVDVVGEHNSGRQMIGKIRKHIPKDAIQTLRGHGLHIFKDREMTEDEIEKYHTKANAPI